MCVDASRDGGNDVRWCRCDECPDAHNVKEVDSGTQEAPRSRLFGHLVGVNARANGADWVLLLLVLRERAPGRSRQAADGGGARGAGGRGAAVARALFGGRAVSP
eukprot:756154-Prorocentrum_minimum.AAC.1